MPVGKYDGPMPRKPRVGVATLREIPNIGPRTEGDLIRIGITLPRQLVGKDGIELYRKVCRVDGVRHDPCVADVFLAAVDYMEGAPRRDWWWYTQRRKKLMPETRR